MHLKFFLLIFISFILSGCIKNLPTDYNVCSIVSVSESKNQKLKVYNNTAVEPPFAFGANILFEPLFAKKYRYDLLCEPNDREITITQTDYNSLIEHTLVKLYRMNGKLFIIELEDEY